MKKIQITLDPSLEGIKEMLRFFIITLLSGVITYALDTLIVLVSGYQASTELETLFLVVLAGTLRGLEKKWHEQSKVTGQPNLLVKTLTFNTLGK